MTTDPRFERIGRIFYGIAIAAMGLTTIYYRDFPYFLMPPNHAWISDHPILVYLSGAFLLLAGVCIALEKKLRAASLLLGIVLGVIFCFYFIPYQLMVSPKNAHFGDWENAAKELALVGGAFVIAGVRKLAVPAIIVYALTILSFGIDHFLYAKQAMGYIPAWIPYKLFWMYFCGLALLGSSIAIILNINRRLFAFLLGTMIFIWVVILHFPKSIAAPIAENAGEITSGFLALAYCGIAFVIAGAAPKIPTIGAANPAPARGLSKGG